MSSFILGAGRVGRTLISVLQSAGEPLSGASNRSEKNAHRTTAELGIPTQASPCPVIPPETRIAWLTVPDREIGAAARCAAPQLHPDAILVHTSGTLPSAMLRSHAPTVGSVVGAHPLQTMTGAPDDLERIHGCHWFLEGEPEALQTITALLQRLGMHTHPIRPESRPLYHAAAVLASNAAFGLHNAATRLLVQAGVDTEDAAAALVPLMTATLSNLQKMGAPKALTGPVARGEVDVVASHLDVLAREAPECEELYRALLDPLLRVAREQGNAAPDLLDAIDRIRRESSTKSR